MKIIKALLRIWYCKSCNPLTFSRMKICDKIFRISLQPRREGRDGFNKQSIHSQCMLGFILMGLITSFIVSQAVEANNFMLNPTLITWRKIISAGILRTTPTCTFINSLWNATPSSLIGYSPTPYDDDSSLSQWGTEPVTGYKMRSPTHFILGMTSLRPSSTSTSRPAQLQSWGQTLFILLSMMESPYTRFEKGSSTFKGSPRITTFLNRS